MYTQVAKPFVKWAGGKRQLLPIINENLPEEIKNNKINKYIEPFVGGGAVLFDIVSKYNFDQIIINDYNQDLMHLYSHIKNDIDRLIPELKKISDSYLVLGEEERSEFFYNAREQFNMINSNTIEKSVLFIFLNRTCFNGLYRVNSKGKFNVPYGRYKSPMILDEDNLYRVSDILSKVIILSGDFSRVEEYADDKTFVYFDPPYRPLSVTSSFTSYSKNDFNDDEQKRLAEFFIKLHNKGVRLMLSNSDPKNIDIDNNFFDDLYNHPNFNIRRVEAKRNINSNGNGRGKITELLITNY
ncbi:DNA adenine methylase [Tissierella creatinini]|nr:DNA adenine methylase [Tissierella creatinini]TJX63948.1 DNA adenine methylase [Soehngenia saccharolytica]